MPAVAKLTPPRRRSETDVAYEIRRLHDCMHAVGESVTALACTVDTLSGTVEDVKGDMTHVRERVSFIEGRQVGIATRLAVPEDPDKEVKASPWFSFGRLRTVGVAVGIIAGLPVAWTVVSTLAQVAAAALSGMAH